LLSYQNKCGRRDSNPGNGLGRPVRPLGFEEKAIDELKAELKTLPKAERIAAARLAAMEWRVLVCGG